MSVAAYSLISVIAVSLIPLLGIAVIFQKKLRKNLVLFLISLSVGALFGDAFIHLIPESFDSDLGGAAVSFLIILGIVIFFLMEKFLHWNHNHIHEHSRECENKILPIGHINIASDALHNFIDGIIIAASYLVSMEVGLATTLAVILHEIPQEIGDVGILLHAGFSKMKAVWFNLLTGLAAIAGTVLALALTNLSATITLWALPIAAGTFIYIAGSDLVPELHKEFDIKKSFIQVVGILLGLSLMFALLLID